MKKYDYDFAVIGGGPAGRRAAVQAAKLGKSVALIDDQKMIGGVSVHTGTLPSKTIRESVMSVTGWRDQHFRNRQTRLSPREMQDMIRSRLLTTLGDEVDVLDNQLARNNVATIKGRAKFTARNMLEITLNENGITSQFPISAKKFLISTGTRPFRPDNIPFNDRNIVDSDIIASDVPLPQSIIVVGGGVIGLEYATIFSAMDIPVTIVERRERLLEFIDHDVVDNFLNQLRERGIGLRLGRGIKEIHENEDGQACITLDDNRHLKAEMVLYTAGREGSIRDLGLENVGIEPDNRGRIEVNSRSLQTSQKHIYAAGDVIGFPSLASTSMEQGRQAACHAFGAATENMEASFPLGIYSVPEIASIGLSEQDARAQGHDIEVGIARFRETSRGHILGNCDGMMKCIYDLKSHKLLGVHIVGEGATELVHIGQAVLNLGGRIDYFVQNTFNFPTLAEAYKIAALDAWNRLPDKTVSATKAA